MPRPRVRPEDRQRAERACDPCKSSKKRCNGGAPCASCSRKGVSSSCLYTARRRRGNPRTAVPRNTQLGVGVPAVVSSSSSSSSTVSSSLTPPANSIHCNTNSYGQSSGGNLPIHHQSHHRQNPQLVAQSHTYESGPNVSTGTQFTIFPTSNGGQATSAVSVTTHDQQGVEGTFQNLEMQPIPGTTVAALSVTTAIPQQLTHTESMVPRGISTPTPSFAPIMDPQQPHETTQNATMINSTEATAACRDKPDTEQKPVMVVSFSGEKVFVGNTAAISFLSLLQKVLKRYMGPSQFTDIQKNRKILELDVPEPPCDGAVGAMTDINTEELIGIYLQATCGIFDLFSDEEIHALTLAHSNRPPTNRSATKRSEIDDEACLYAMVAIGAQCRMQDARDQEIAIRYFAKARTLAFDGFIQQPTIGLIKTFLLLAFYMLGACRRNAAFMFIGVASRASIVLGIHASNEESQMSNAEKEKRNRVGKSLRVLDLVCSSILGRPGTSLKIREDNRRLANLDPRSCSHRSLSLAASYEACGILEEIVQEFTEHGNSTTEMSAQFLIKLQEWNRGLPQDLRKGSVGHPAFRTGPQLDAKAEVNRRSMIVGNIHTACMYYFGVILVTRQYMIQHVVSKLELMAETEGAGRSPSSESTESNTAQKNAEVERFTNTCINAALYLAEMCIEAFNSDDLLYTMCTLKAWMFVSSLVLGFSLLLHPDSELQYKWSTAFSRLRSIFGYMAKVSPQALQYTQLLATFAEAINSYNESRQAQGAEVKYTTVERILTYSEDLTAAPMYTDSSAFGGAPAGSTQIPGFNNGNPGLFDHLAADFSSMLGADDLAMSWGPTDSEYSSVMPDIMGLVGTFTNEYGQP